MMKVDKRIVWSVVLAAAAVVAPGSALKAAPAQGAANVQQAEVPDKAQQVIDKATGFLKAQQKPDGGWQDGTEPPAITAIVLKAYLQDPHHNQDQALIDKGFKKLLSYQQPDGSIASDVLATYNTAIAISTFAAADSKYKDAQDKALQYLRSIQWSDKIQGVKDRSKHVDESNPNYGGWGYGSRGRADLSNVQMALDALHDSGLKSDDPAYQAALKFITRTQNNSETNDQKWSGDDGGFIYTAADGGASMAGTLVSPDGKKIFRSYGSMTYAGLKSMIYAGLTKNDPRVKAAWKWIRENWTLDQNPGMQYADATKPEAADWGLFYYYHTLARALRAYGEPVITDAKGNKHDWRVELIQKIAQQQQPDGSWAGKQHWMENKPVLATAYAVLALEEAQQDLKEHPAQK
jgi:squalene-hopene/tetraprenyl-beta-curcumene cyclase